MLRLMPRRNAPYYEQIDRGRNQHRSGAGISAGRRRSWCARERACLASTSGLTEASDVPLIPLPPISIIRPRPFLRRVIRIMRLFIIGIETCSAEPVPRLAERGRQRKGHQGKWPRRREQSPALAPPGAPDSASLSITRSPPDSRGRVRVAGLDQTKAPGILARRSSRCWSSLESCPTVRLAHSSPCHLASRLERIREALSEAEPEGVRLACPIRAPESPSESSFREATHVVGFRLSSSSLRVSTTSSKRPLSLP